MSAGALATGSCCPVSAVWACSFAMTRSSLGRPACAAGLEINPVSDGYIVYQPDRDRIHYLNATAALVLELCNGRNDVNELAALLQLAFDLGEPPHDAVAECLDTLMSEGLVH
ncbi:MAG: PqqD family protein [Reyranella sp.]|nr:MAG: PqqD family protein [Reyranella sp.]